MSDTNFNLYLQKVFTFVKTIVIKDVVSAETINQELITNGYSVRTDQPETWKYYLNLAGQYHESDTKMQITSLDTLETVEFNPTVLNAHRATKRAYRYGTTYYNLLLNKYPDQEQLILGCLNPVDITTAIAADDHAILYYDTALVEPQESNLILKLQAWINAYFIRWCVTDYRLTDNLYQAALWVQLMQQMVPEVLNIRLGNCKTRFAHSYHIREYLASHGGLDIYYDALTIEQALWLYRNIEYIRKHAGKQSTFDWLVENILSKRQIPLYDYSLRHNLADQPDSLTPTVDLTRTQINLRYAGKLKTVKDLNDTLKLEFPEARDNLDLYEDDLVATEKAMRNSLSNYLPTKILESDIVDQTDAAPFDFPTLLLNQWIYYVSKNILTATTIVSNPSTGQDMVLSAKEALTIWVYAISKLNGFTPLTMPAIHAIHVRKVVLPTKADLRKLVPDRHLSDLTLNALTDGLTITPTKIIAAETFYEHCSGLFSDLTRQRAIVNTREHYLSRGLAEIVAEHHYQDCLCSINEGIVFGDWLAEQGFEIKNLTSVEYEELTKSIVAAATGADQHTTITIKELQTAMLAIMEQLSSYSVQYIQTINDSGFKMVGPTAIRLGDIGIEGEAHHRANLPTTRALSTGGFSRAYYDPDVVDGHDLDFTFDSKGHASGMLLYEPELKQTNMSSMNFRIPGHRVGVLGFKITEGVQVAVTTITSVAVTIIESDTAQTVSGYLPMVRAHADVEFVPFTALYGTKHYGYFSLNADGQWIYYMDGPHNEFVADQTYTESIDVSSTDGAMGTITVTIRGTEDVAYFTDAAVLLNETNTVLHAQGNIAIIDPDSTTTFVDFADQEGVNGYGYFTISKQGSWSFVAKAAYDSLPASASIMDYVNVVTTDGTNGRITVTIQGTDDLTIFLHFRGTSDNNGTRVVASGQIELVDLDNTPALVPMTDVRGQAGYGTFTVMSSGDWTYITPDVSFMTQIGTYIDSVVVTSVDGVTGLLKVFIINEHPELPFINIELNEDGS